MSLESRVHFSKSRLCTYVKNYIKYDNMHAIIILSIKLFLLEHDMRCLFIKGHQGMLDPDFP